jgi:hypothetical protein
MELYLFVLFDGVPYIVVYVGVSYDFVSLFRKPIVKWNSLSKLNQFIG